MKALVLGAGEVGQTVVEALSADTSIDISVVDVDQAALKRTQDLYPCTTELGSATSLRTLENAGIRDSDVLIAVTKGDEFNLLACNLAYQLFDTPQRIARIRDVSLLRSDVRDTLFNNDRIGVNYPVCPEHIVVEQLRRLVLFEGALDVAEFVDERLLCVLLVVEPGSKFAGVPTTNWSAWREFGCQVVSIQRDSRFIHPIDDGSVEVKVNDTLLLLGFAKEIEHAVETSRSRRSYRHIAIAGGGTIGTQLAASVHELTPHRHVKVLEGDLERSQVISKELNTDSRLTVLQGDATDKNFLERNDINDSDLLCAVTNDDLVNVICSQLSKQLNVGTVFTLLKNLHYIEPLQEMGIEMPISPQESTASFIHSVIRERTLAKFHRVRRLGVDVVELIVQGDSSSSNVVGKSPDQLSLPQGTYIIAVVREQAGEWKLHTHLQMDGTTIQTNDRVLLILERSDAVKTVEQLFRAKAFSLF